MFKILCMHAPEMEAFLLPRHSYREFRDRSEAFFRFN